MENQNDTYVNPLTTRYASKEMQALFSERKRITLFRYLWLALAKGEKKLGLNISDEQINELQEYVEKINFDVAKEREMVCRHDVMAHVYAYGVQCPKASPIIHFGATSCYVTDNADIIIYKEAMEKLSVKLVAVINKLSKFATKYKALPTLGFTHLQAAQLVTVGKRATLWIQDFIIDYNNLMFQYENLPMRGIKGATGTQATFLQLFNNDHKKVKELDEYIVNNFGFLKSVPVSGQTYTRKIDYSITSVLSMIAQSCYKFSNDIRLLQHMKEIEEPFESGQIGSSAMAYKRNPMRSERIGSLARYVLSLPVNAAITASTQWFERTLDDSANRRIVMGQAFLSVDALLELMLNVSENLVVYENIIQKHIAEELPFMATEMILMECVINGGDRQELHEIIREYSMIVAKEVKIEGKTNNLIQYIKNDTRFACIHESIDNIMQPQNFVGRSAEQVDEFVNDEVIPIIEKYKNKINISGHVNV